MSCHASKVKTLLFTVCFTLAGCGSSGTSPDQNDNGTTSSKTSIFNDEDFLSDLENSRTLPKSVKTISELLELDCNTTSKCGKVFVEDKDIYEYFQCDGTEWLPAKNTKFKKLCSIKKEENDVLPERVATLMDLGGIECNADRKCKRILVEEYNDTYECDGEKQWNMLLDGIPSNVCPAETGIIGLDDATYKEGKIACVVSSTNPYVQETRMNDLRIKTTITLGNDGKVTEEIEHNQVIPQDTCDHYNLDPVYESVTCTDQKITAVNVGTMKAAEFEALANYLAQACEKSNGSNIPEAVKDDEGAESESPESSTSTPASTDSGTESSSSGEEITGPTGDLVSCLQEYELIDTKGKACSEATANSETATQLMNVCISVDFEGMKITSTVGNGCPATGFVKKCIVSNEVATYYFDDDAANKSCEELSQS